MRTIMESRRERRHRRPDSSAAWFAAGAGLAFALDLDGFAISGPTACSGSGASLVCAPIGSGAGHGIAAVPAARAGIAVSNGIVRGMRNGGIQLGPDLCGAARCP